MIRYGVSAVVVAALVVAAVDGEKWAWPEHQQHRPDGKVRFEDSTRGLVEQDEAASDTDTGSLRGADYRQNETEQPAEDNESAAAVRQFVPPSDTAGFYNRPPGGPETGRYPVQSLYHGGEPPRRAAENYQVNRDQIFPVNSYGHLVSYTDRRPQSPDWAGGYDGTLDSLSYCRCLHTRNCLEPNTIGGPCDVGKSLCCSNRRREKPQKQQGLSRPNDYQGLNNYHNSQSNAPGVLVGPGGPTGTVGPKPGYLQEFPPGGLLGPIEPTNAILVGPGGATGIIGPYQPNRRPGGVLVGPGGPTGLIGPTNRPILVGPGGPTGIIGPASVIRAGNSGANGILVGPGGPTGIIGPRPNRYSNNGVLVGPGGPTGILGPRRTNRNYDPQTSTTGRTQTKARNRVMHKKKRVMSKKTL